VTTRKDNPPGVLAGERTFDGQPIGDILVATAVWRVSEWLAATLEMWCPERGCGFESHALRFDAEFSRQC